MRVFLLAALLALLAAPPAAQASLDCTSSYRVANRGDWFNNDPWIVRGLHDCLGLVQGSLTVTGIFFGEVGRGQCAGAFHCETLSIPVLDFCVRVHVESASLLSSTAFRDGVEC